MTNLTANFTLEEATRSATAVRLGIDNTAPDDVVEHLKQSAAGMELVRALLGGKPMHTDSAYRCEALERALCGKDFAAWCARRELFNDDRAWSLYFATKAHPKGWAWDFVCPDYGTPAEIVEAIAASDIEFDQCIMEGSWVHISFDPMMRRQVMQATFAADGTPTYTAAG